MSKYCQQLKNKYNSLSLGSPEELLECKSSRYVNLLFTKFDKKSKREREELVSGQLNNIMMKSIPLSSSDTRSLTIADVLDVKEEENKVILIEGGPGMGKSTLAIKICKCWADGELLEEYDVVILLPLRDPEIQAAKTLKDLLLILDDDLRECVYKEITKRNGEGICFLLEGFDELPHHLQNSSIFSKLSEKLPECTLVYTSRPEACDKLRSVSTQRIEIRGFKEEQVDEYINNAFEDVEDGKEKALKLTAQVKSNPSIRSILSVPINVAIICHLFLLTLTLPNTLTQLYTLLCINLILRHINKHTPGRVEYLSSLHNLPTQTDEQFLKLCLIAYRGREEDKIIFSSSELEIYGIDVNKLSGLGLLLIAPSTSVYGREKSYNFLHLTVQEFCAAFYISKLPDKEQYECFKKYQFYDSFQMLWRMYCGITRLKNKDIFHHMLPSKWVKLRYRKRRIIELLHCVYEAHNDEVCNVVGNHLDGNIDLSFCTLDQISCSALGYLLEQYRGALRVVNLSYCNIGDEGCRILLNSLLSYHDNSSKFELNLCDNKITDKSSSLIASLLSSNYPITKLDVGFNVLSSSTDIIFKSLRHNNVLTELLLWFTSLRSSDIQSLGPMLTSNNTLSVIDISANDIVPDYITDWRNISLNKLIMSNCKLGVSGADKIGKMLYHNKSITSVDLGSNDIGDEGVEKLVEHLKSNKTIKHLSLWDNNITSNGANQMSKLFSSSLNHTTVNSIELGNNPLKDDGVDLILQSITITMEYVGLYNTGMSSSCSSVSTALHKIKSIDFTPPDNCDGISDSLADTTVLEELELRDGSDTANHTMISGINRNNSIKKLKFYKGQLHYQTLSNLVEVIKVNKIITELLIWDVDVSPSDYLLLADVLTVNTCIKEMTISPSVENELDQSLVLQLLKQLKHNYTLEVLSLEVTNEARDDEQFIRDVEILVEDMNNIRHSHGVTTPLHVKLW